jgi:hypothetical protein
MEIKLKVVVFCDEGIEEWETYYERDFTDAGISFANLEVFEDASAFKQSFQILMFDWGGMSMGNSIIDSLIRELYRMAEESPSKDFVLLSRFTHEAYQDMNKDKNPDLFNIYSAKQYIEKLKLSK